MLLENYFFSVDFDLEELNQKYKPDMVNQFIQKKIVEQDQSAGYNMEYVNPAYTKVVANKFHLLVEELFDVSELLNPIKTWMYVQNNEHCTDNWHDHVRTASVNGVFYIDPPENGGALQLIYLDTVHTVEIQPKRLYIFPGWLCHRPTKQEDENWRVSINVEYYCRHRPIVKSTGIIW
jgi:hypothetical protein